MANESLKIQTKKQICYPNQKCGISKNLVESKPQTFWKPAKSRQTEGKRLQKDQITALKERMSVESRWPRRKCLNHTKNL